MKKKHYIILFSTMFLLVLFVTSFVFYGIRNALTNVDQNTGIIIPDREPVYHFAMICENVDDPFWLSIKKGVERASKEFNVAVEFNGPNVANIEEQRKYLDIAIASKVDGIVTYVWDEKETGQLIDRGINRGIPVVTVGTDAKTSMRAAFVGVNTYDSGVHLGRMLIAATGDQGEAAILVSNNQIGGRLAQGLLVSGIRDAVSNYPEINIKTIEYNNLLDLEDVIKNLLANKPNLDTIICTAARDTTVVTERLIDLNRVGYNIIGYGDSPEMLRYIDKGVIFGTVTADLEQMGYDTIRALMDIKEKGRTSAYFKVDTRLITKENISEYLESGED
ncbi:MAG: substrate-binding domain-containing protein [Bacillota bacterium]